MRTITRTDVQKAIRYAVARTPHAQNPQEPPQPEKLGGPSCLNWGPNGTRCIASQVLFDLGVDIKEAGAPVTCDIEEGVKFVERKYDEVIVTEKAKMLLKEAQYHFDNTRDYPWARSLETFSEIDK
jgi:hypothetical protein